MNFSVEAALLVVSVVFIILIGVSWYFEMANEREFSFTYSASLTAVIVAIVTPVVFSAGSSAYRSSIAEYQEFWNGLEVEAVQSVKTCEYNGYCAHTYNCDPYWETEYYTDSEGNRQSRQVTKYNSCPYSTHEVDYYVTDTLGNKHYFGDNFFLPDAKEWRGGSGLPSGVPREIPVKWQEAKGRLDVGNPGGVTEIHGYSNWILALQHTVLDKYSDTIPYYLDKEQLPVVANYIHDLYHTEKAYFIGLQPEDVGDPAKWHEETQRFNGKFGAEKQGDLHVVVVNNELITEPDRYAQALNAYWLSSDYLGQNTLSKNGVVLIFGITPEKTYSQQKAEYEKSDTQQSGGLIPGVGVVQSGGLLPGLDSVQSGTPNKKSPPQKVTWVRAFTGMPEGNEILASKLSSDDFVQTVSSQFYSPEKLFNADGGMKLVYDSYIRVNMKEYEYLKDSIPVSTGATVGMFFADLLFSLIALFLVNYARFAFKDRYM